MTEKTRLDVFDCQRFFEKGIVEEIELRSGNIIGCAPIGVDFAELVCI